MRFSMIQDVHYRTFAAISRFPGTVESKDDLGFLYVLSNHMGEPVIVKDTIEGLPKNWVVL